MIAKTVDYFMPTEVISNLDNHSVERLRFYIVFCLILCINISIVLFYDWFFSPLDVESRVKGLLLKLPIALVYIGCPFLLKYTGHYRIGVWLLSCSILVVGAVAMYVTGGPSRSPTVLILALPPMIVFFLEGMRAGIWATALMTLTLIALFKLEDWGFQYQFWINAEAVKTMDLTVTVVALASILGLTIAYEMKNNTVLDELQSQRIQMETMAHTDSLTGLGNRFALARAIQHIGTVANRQYGLVVVDLDDFKQVNDTYGHPVGDRFLQEVAHRLRETVSEEHAFRVGGDEFVLLIPGADSKGGITHRLRAMKGEPVKIDGVDHALSFSLGVSMLDPENGNFEEALKKADRSLYSNKRRDDLA